MKDKPFLSKRPCEFDFRAAATGQQESACHRPCPWLKNGACRSQGVWCLMDVAIVCAKQAIEQRRTIFAQVRRFMELIDARETPEYSGIFTPGGATPTDFIWADGDAAPRVITNVSLVPKLIIDFAEIAMSGGVDSDTNGVIANSMRDSSSGPVLSLAAMQTHEGRFGYNGGQGCDVLEGPCSCGAWHHRQQLI